MDFEDDDDPLSRENYQAVDEDAEEEAAPQKKRKNADDAEHEELVNEKRGYTSQERDMIAEWLKKHKPKTDTPESEEEE